MTITFNIIIYTHIIPRDRLSIGCLAAISHPPLMVHYPHFFTLGCVTLRWFAGQNRPSCGISFLSFSECISQGEILWCCQGHNVGRLNRGKMWENEIQWILSYSLSNNISLCWDLNYCVRCGCGVTVSRPHHSGSMRGDEVFLRKCRLTGTSKIKAVGMQRFVMNHARQALTAALSAGVWFGPFYPFYYNSVMTGH